MNILLVEDDQVLAESIKDILIKNGYNTETVFTGSDGLEYGRSGLYDIIILDVMLPGLSGFEVVKELRKENIKIPVIMLTARSEIKDRVDGLDCGADDYLTKPFSSDELLARLRALSRRPLDVVTDSVKFGDVILNINNFKLSCCENNLQLSQKEFDLMNLLIAYAGTIISKEFIIVKVWGSVSEIDENNVEAYISFLRKKLFFIGSKVEIKTHRKLGYSLEVQDD